MGLKDKLSYLEETKRILRDTLEEMGATVTDEDTFRSYAEKFANATPDTNYIREKTRYNEIGGEPYYHTDLIGTYEPKNNDTIFPRVVYPEVEDAESVSVTLPFTGRTAAGNYAASAVGGAFDFQKVSAPKNYEVKLYLNMVKPFTLILPDRVNLVQYTLYNGQTGTDSYSFTRGLGFGQSVRNSVSTWINRTLSSTKRVVKFPPGFQMDSGSTLYLSKIYITQACMKEMVQNLYDYIGNGETTEVTRTISVGSTNKALLTPAEIDLATAKGWKITA